MKILLIAITVLFTSCYTIEDYFASRKIQRTNLTDLLPAGTIKIGENLFIDEIEISTFSYNEFLWYIKRIYGDTSLKYLSLLPVSSNDDFKKYFKLGDFDLYQYHPYCRDYPVIAVSYLQATEFNKWRSDRVMEFFLINKKIIKHNISFSEETQFTIDKYFTGNYLNYKPDKSITHYPCYELPDSTTFMKALRFSDSLNKINTRFCNDNPCTKSILTLNCYENYLLKTDTSILVPTEATYCSHYGFRGRYKAECKKPIITHLLGNVREMTNIQGITFGGSYIDSCYLINKSYFYTDSVPNYHTGLRMMCHFKKWKN